MNDLLKHAFDAEAFRQQGHRLVDIMAQYIQDVQHGDNLSVFPYYRPEDMREYWKNDLQSTQGSPNQDIVSCLEDVLKKNVHTLHPNFMGHQVATVVPVVSLADAMASLMNSGLGVYEMGSPIVAIENILIQQIAEFVGYDDTADGVFTSGGSLGNLTALLAARKAKLGHNVWQEGYKEQDRIPALMVSEESHYCVDRAIRIMGWGEQGIIKIPVNEQYQMRTELLEEYYQKAASQGKQVIALVANACSTATGSYDPLDEIADFCEKHDLWLHVDGAHGGAVIFSPKYRALVKGIERADSLIIDFHKMMMMPALTTALLFKDGEKSYQTFAQKAQYLWQDPEEKEWYNLGKRTFECTKNTMTLRVYAVVRSYGWKLFAEHIDQTYDLGHTFARLIEQAPDFDLLIRPEANILCFRYRPSQLEERNLEQINLAIRQALIEEGNYYIVQTQVKGKTYLRTTLINPFTTEKELKGLLDKIRNIYSMVIEKAFASLK